MMPEIPVKQFVFIQMNMWEGRLHYPLARFLEQRAPVILAAQEVLSRKHVKTIHSQFLTQEDMLERGFFQQMSAGLAINWLDSANYKMRCATFVQGPAKISSEFTCELYRDEQDHSDDENRRANYSGLLHTVITLEGAGIVHVLNHHGRIIRGKRMGSEVTDYNFQKIAEYIATLQGPVILSGDFNLYKGASSFVPLKEIGMKNLNDVYGIEAARNEFAWKPEECVSHIFINDDIIAHDYHIATENVSDHLPLVLKFSIKS